MLVRAEKTEARTPRQTCDSFTEKVTDNREREKAQYDEERFVRVRFRQTGGTHCDETDEQSGKRKHCADCRALFTRCAAHDLGSAPRAYQGAIGNVSLAVRANQRFHSRSITNQAMEERIFSRITSLPQSGCWRSLRSHQVPNGGNAPASNAAISPQNLGVPTTECADTSGNLDIMGREGEMQSFPGFAMNEGGRD
jgi:hypothetical protein